MSKSSFVLRNGSGIPYKLNDSPSTTPESMLQPPVSLPEFSEVFISRLQEVCSAHRSPHDTTGHHSGPHGVSATTERRSRWAVSGFVDAARHRVARPELPPNNFDSFYFLFYLLIFFLARHSGAQPRLPTNNFWLKRESHVSVEFFTTCFIYRALL